MTMGAYLGENVVREKEYLSAMLSFYSRLFRKVKWTGSFATGFGSLDGIAVFDVLDVEEWQAMRELLSFGCKLEVPEFPPQAVTVQGPGTGKLRVELELDHHCQQLES